jgi:beta-lactamase regulating signal transducer with metallopeptidase domain
MTITEWAFNRLAEWAAINLVLFAVGSLAVVCCRQPVHRLRIVLLTLAAAFVAPLVNLVPSLPHWRLPVLASPADGDRGSLNVVSEELREKGEERLTKDTQAVTELAGSEADFVEEEAAKPALAIAEDWSDRALDPAFNEQPTAAVIETTTAPHEGTTAGAVSVDLCSSIRLGAVVFYLGGVAGLFVWWLLGVACLWRLVRTAVPAGDACRAMFAEIAGPVGNGVKLLVSSRAQQPFTFSWLKPVIVLPLDLVREAAEDQPVGWALPTSPMDDGGRSPPYCAKQAAEMPLTLSDGKQPGHVTTGAQLRFCLAHEWAHIERGDVWFWSLAGLIRLVHFYQPLCWWLRGQLRLCQDYLADAAAARLASPASYAEFLATRAAGRPLPIGLGIAGSQSELLRRVAMLVQNPLRLEARCSTRWTFATACAALALTVLAATFRGQPDVLAADEAAASRVAMEAPAGAQPPQSDDPGVTNNEAPVEAVKAASPPKVADETETSSTITAAARSRILDHLATRTTRFQGGTISFEQVYAFADAGETKTVRRFRHLFMMYGTTWFLCDEQTQPPAAGGTPGKPPTFPFTLVVGGRCLQGALSEGPPRADETNTVHLRLARNSSLHIKHPEAVAQLRERPLPVNFGTVYYEAGRRFIRDHAGAARFAGIAEVEVPVFKANIEGLKIPVFEDAGRTRLRTQLIEWDVAGDDAGEAFPNGNEFLKRGGLLRVYVAEELDDLVAAIEGIDRFGTVQFSVAFFPGQSVKAGEFQMGARFESGGSLIDYTAAELIPAGQKPNNVRIVLSIPVGVSVLDERQKTKDVPPKNPAGAALFDHNREEYPFHSFTTTAPYPDGFPNKLQDEIDRDVLPWDSPRRFQPGDFRAGGSRRGAASSTTGKGGVGSGSEAAAANKINARKNADASTATSTVNQAGEEPARTTRDNAKNQQPIRAGSYGGKSFSEWRQMLIDDLEPATRIRALEAIGTFGANGYATEAAEAISGILLTGKEQSNNDRTVAQAACTALSRLGAAGVPVLQKQLDGDDNTNRRYAIQSLIALARSTDAALPALLEAIRDDDENNRGLAYRALAERFLNSDKVFDAVQAALKTDSSRIRSNIAGSLRSSSPDPEKELGLLRLLLQDEDENVRRQANIEFALRARGTSENIVLLNKSLLKIDGRERRSIMESISRAQVRIARADAELLVPILIAFLKDGDSRSATEWGGPVACIKILGNLAQEKIAESAIPVLIEIVDQGSKGSTLNPGAIAESMAASDALGRFGARAKSALPALKRRRDEYRSRQFEISLRELQQSGRLHSVEEYPFRIQAAIRAIEGE